jgi:hypothetical protein
MDMKLRLSHSAATKYQDCPKSYYWHYKKNLRSKTKSAALFFGTAIDKAMDDMLSNKSNGQDTFISHWHSQEHNGKPLVLKDSLLLVYANSDLDVELLSTEALEDLKQYTEKEDVLKELESISKQKAVIGYEMLPKKKKLLFNAANWHCLYRKGLLMLKALEEEVLPNITEVLGTQKQVELVSDNGDTVLGYADLVCKWKDRKEPVVFDLKTAARAYDDDAVIKSPQLALYVYGLYNEFKTHTAGFIVLSKQIQKNKIKTCKSCGNDGSGKNHKTCDALIEDKRCHGEWDVRIDPKASVQVLIDKVPERFQDMVVENMNEVNHAIRAEVYPRSFSSCIKPFGKCAFYSLCHEGTMDGLVEEEK